MSSHVAVGDERHPLVRLDAEAHANRVARAGQQLGIDGC